MRILGIDPSPSGIAYAVFKSNEDDCGGDIEVWGTVSSEESVWLFSLTPNFDYCAIELPVIHPKAGNEVRDTILTTGIWIERLCIPPHLWLTRSTISAALHARGDAAINRALAVFCPALRGRKKGLMGDVRAAAAVAYIAAGRVK